MDNNQQIFNLLSYDAPQKRVSYAYLNEQVRMEYSATRTKEILHIYRVATRQCIASFYRSLSIVATASEDGSPPLRQAILKVAGPQWKEYKHLMGVDVPEGEVPPTVESYGFYPIPGRNLTMQKDLKYEIEAQSTEHVLRKIGNSVEDYLYELRELQDIADEKGLDMRWVERKNYRVLTRTEDIQEFLLGLRAAKTIVGFDTETTGLLVGVVKLDKLVGISMSYEDDTGVYFPIAHKRFENVEMGLTELIHQLRPYIDRRGIFKKDLVTHNGGFDWKTMKMYGIDLNIVHDTFIRQGLLEIAEAKFINGLKAIAKKVLEVDVIELEDMYKSKTKQDIRDVKVAVFEKGLAVDDITRYKLERASEFKDVQFDFRFASYSFAETYGPADADFPRLIFQKQEEIWDPELDFVYRTEINLIPVLGEQEYYGVTGIKERFDNLHTKTLNEMKELESQIYALAGYEFNISSGPQKGKLLFEEMGCPVLPRYKTKKGGYKTDADTLKELSRYKNDDGSPKYPIIPLLLNYTKKATLVKNFYGKIPLLLHGGRLLPSYKQLGTETGRVSCSKPNLQQTEPTSREYMVPDTPDHYFLICDYSQVEYRIMAGMSGEQKVVDFFANNPEADYHILAYANMMGKAYEDVTSAERKIGKVLNFGTTYGLEDEALALALFGNSTPYHQRMAAEKRKQYFDGVPVLRDYFERIRDEAQENGFVRTLFGRIRRIPEFNYKGYIPEYKIQSGRRKAGNMPVQGTAADIMKMAMIRVHRILRKMEFTEDQIRLVMNIHDELVIQVHKSINMWYALSIVRKAMEIDMSGYGFPPLYIGANVGYCWKDGKADHLEAPVLLMDEKIAEINAMLERGETLPTYEDPRTVWANEISQFALRQVRKEIEENNYTTIAQCYKNIRIMKYARHFETTRIVDGEEESVSFDNNIIYLLLDRNNTVEHVWSQLDDLLANMPIVEYSTNTADVRGRELPQGDNAVLDYLREYIQYDRAANILHVQLEHMDSDFLTLMDKLLVPLADQWRYNERNFCKVNVKIAQELACMLPNRFLMGALMPLVKDMMTVHLFGGEYMQIEREMDRIKAQIAIVWDEQA